MNKKLVIPTMLAATILVAGMFAFMPVQKASTVHTTITSAITATTFSDAAVDQAPGAAGLLRNVAATDGKKFLGTVTITATNPTGAAVTLLINVNDGDGLQAVSTTSVGIGATVTVIAQVSGSDPTGTTTGLETFSITGNGLTVVDFVFAGTVDT